MDTPSYDLAEPTSKYSPTGLNKWRYGCRWLTGPWGFWTNKQSHNYERQIPGVQHRTCKIEIFKQNKYIKISGDGERRKAKKSWKQNNI